MSKSTITRLFVIAIGALAVGLVIGTAAVVAALADGAVALGGTQVVTLHAEPVLSAVGPLVVASLVVAVGTVAAVASWVGALLNTSRLDDRTWFVALLVLGLVSLGWVAMIAYVVAGPDARDRPLPLVGSKHPNPG